MRKKRDDIRAISTATRFYEPIMGQCFYETPKAYELWLIDPLMRLRRWDKKRVYWIILKEDA